MRRKKPILQIRLYLIGAFILLTGLIGAVSIYLMATDDSSDAVGYEFVDGKAYPILANESKTYRHDLERFGGKAAVMADDLNRWFTGLWKGKRLAITLAVLSTGAALAFFWAARRLSRNRTEDRDC
jgi:hypothetical protein